jgi:pyridoxine 5'-phosphate synthase PdxJ
VELETAEGHPLIEEYNIGHVIVCRAAMVGLERAVREMVSAIQAP